MFLCLKFIEEAAIINSIQDGDKFKHFAITLDAVKGRCVEVKKCVIFELGMGGGWVG